MKIKDLQLLHSCGEWQRSCNWDHSTAAAQLQMHRGTTRQQGIIKLKVNLQVNNQNFMYL